MKKFILLFFGLFFVGTTNAQLLDSLRHAGYMNYVEASKKAGIVFESEEAWNKQFGNLFKLEVQFPTAPGTYLMKAKNQIIGGFTIQMVTMIAETGIFLTAKDLTVKQMNIINASAGVLYLVGLGLEISGVVNIGKAGLSLNENGIGIKTKF